MKHTLYMSLRSPFARRVRVLLEELGVSYDVQLVDVFNPPASLIASNPLARVPVLTLPTGESIVDSWQILGYLAEQHSEHPLFLYGGASQAGARLISGLAVGVMEMTVASFLESTRSPGLVSTEVQTEYRTNIAKTLTMLNSIVAATPATGYALGSEFRQCDVDLVSALDYARLRLDKDVLKAYPSLESYLERASTRESFKKTLPPA